LDVHLLPTSTLVSLVKD